MPDLMSILANVSSQIAPVIMMMQTFAALLGLWFVASGLIELWGTSDNNATKFMAGGNSFSVMGGVTKLVLGGVMVAMGTLEMVGIMSRTMSDTYVNSRFLSYAPNGSSFDEQRLAAMQSLLGIMQIVGFTAMMKGWLTINKTVKGQSQASLGMAFTWLIGGIIAWNFKWFTDVLNCSFGYNIIGMFVPFGMQNACR